MILVVLFTLLLLAGMLAATLSLGLGSRQNTADQVATLQSQYAAESGMALARNQLRDFQAILTTSGINYDSNTTAKTLYIELPAGTTPAGLELYSKLFCGKIPTNLWTNTADYISPRGGNDVNPYPEAKECLVNYKADGKLSDPEDGMGASARLSILADIVKPVAYSRLPSTERPPNMINATLNTWWLKQLNSSIVSAAGNTKISLRPLKVVKLDNATYRFYFGVAALSARGSDGFSNRTISGKRTNDSFWWVQVELPSLLTDVLATNHHRSSTSQAVDKPDINFNDQKFYGPVRTNEKFLFSPGSTSVFYDSVTSAGCTNLPDIGPSANCISTKGAYNGNILVEEPSKLSGKISFLKAPDFIGPYKPLPVNVDDQKELANSKGITLSGLETGVKLYAGDNKGIHPSPYSISNKKWPEADYQYIDIYKNISKVTTVSWDYSCGFFITQYCPKDKTGYEKNIGGTKRYFKDVSSTTEIVGRRFRYGVDKKLYEENPVESGIWDDKNRDFNGVIYGDSINKVKGPERLKDISTDKTDRAGSLNNIPPSLTSFSGITIAAKGDINLEDDLAMSDTPCNFKEVQENINPCPKVPLPKNVLGIFSSEGNISITKDAPENLQLHATLLASSGAVKVIDHNKGSSRGDVTVVGSVIENWYGPFGTFGDGETGYGRKFYYDTRLRMGITPPGFPVSPKWQTVDASGADLALDRIAWQQIPSGKY